MRSLDRAAADSKLGSIGMEALEFPLTGGCGCEAVRFEVRAPLGSALYCHCTRCQRRTGAGGSATALAQPGSFRIVSGEDRLRAWRPASGWEKWYCGDCGSAVFSRHPSEPERLGARLGAFDADPGVRPGLHQFVATAALWEAIPDDGLPRFAESSRSH